MEEIYDKYSDMLPPRMGWTARAYVEEFEPHANPGSSSESYAHAAPKIFSDTSVYDHYGQKLRIGDVVKIHGRATNSPRYLIVDISPYTKDRFSPQSLRIIARKLNDENDVMEAWLRESDKDGAWSGEQLELVRKGIMSRTARR